MKNGLVTIGLIMCILSCEVKTDKAFIVITSPNGGENLSIDGVYNITWTGSETIENVKLEYTTNDSTWTIISASNPNIGSHAWTPTEASTTCKIRITDVSNKKVSDLSDSSFSTSSSTLRIISPNSGENWSVASKRNITWETIGTVANVKLEYTTDGSSWIVITESVSNVNSYTWTVPGTPSTDCKIRLTNASKVSIGDVSDANFRIGATVTDMDGNVYTTVIVGTQEWLGENLKTTKYRNGKPIPHASGWVSGISTDAYCNYYNDESLGLLYGRIYSWQAVNDTNNIAPEGWHVATDSEWNTLIAYLGGYNVVGCKLKETGTVHWRSPNVGATNESGFTAVPTGIVSFQGFNFGDTEANWWATMDKGATQVFFRYITSGSTVLVQLEYNYEDSYGFHVRCVKD